MLLVVEVELLVRVQGLLLEARVDMVEVEEEVLILQHQEVLNREFKILEVVVEDLEMVQLQDLLDLVQVVPVS